MLDATLDAGASDGRIDLSLTVENAGDEDVELSFRDAQRAEFVAEDADGAAVWRYGDTQMFAMVAGTESLRPGETATYEATWADPPAGDYRVRAWVVADDASAAATAAVAVE